MKREVATNRWIEQFEFPAAYIPLDRNCLLQEEMLKPGDAWFREMWLYYCRINVVGDEVADVVTRGGRVVVHQAQRKCRDVV